MNPRLAMPTMTIDPRQIVLRDRNAIILGRFDALHTRSSLELLNDHDPQVLRVQSEERDLGRYAGCDGAIGPGCWGRRLARGRPGLWCSTVGDWFGAKLLRRNSRSQDSGLQSAPRIFEVGNR